MRYGECAQVQAGPVRGKMGGTDGESEQWFAVERILDRRGGKKKAEVLVKWQGYDEPSWIEESDVDAEALKTMLAISDLPLVP